MPAYKIPGDNKVPVANFRVKYKDVFDLGQLYQFLYEMFKDYGWKAPDGKDHFEHFYWEKDSPGGVRNEIWALWRLHRVPRSSNYFKFHLDLNWHGLLIKPTEVVVEGHKVNWDKGEMEIEFNAVLELDYGKGFDKTPLKQVSDQFRKRFFKKEIDEYAGELYQEAYMFQEALKRWLKIKKPKSGEDIFYKSYSQPSHYKE